MKNMIKVLLVLNHAPDYRESFLRLLSQKVELTVVAQPCYTENLNPPKKRIGYRYIEINSINLKSFLWQKVSKSKIDLNNYDLVCCNFNPRQLTWLYLYFLNRFKFNVKWIWWGKIYGRNNSSAMYYFRKLFFKTNDYCLVYSEKDAASLRSEYGINAISFNNTEIKKSEFKKTDISLTDGLNLLFVGRYHERKKLDRFAEIVKRRDDIRVRLIGPGMNNLKEHFKDIVADKVDIIDSFVTGNELEKHFEWSDMVACPGDVGLLVMNAARYGKGIVIDSKGNHGPEYYLAEQSDQPFIDFSDNDSVDKFFNGIKNNRNKLKEWGMDLQNLAKEKYTVEHMVKVHEEVFRQVYDK